MLVIENLCAEIERKPILKNFSLKVAPGEIHAIMGPNGAGKSTLAKVLAGHPFYECTGGSVHLSGQDLLDLDPCERAKAGLFMSFQYPLEIVGVTNLEFLRQAVSSIQGKPRDREAFQAEIAPIIEQMKIDPSFLERDLNDGFSGGEKKRNEILQMLVLNPQCAILDETDSGLDIDALRIVAEGIHHFMNPTKALILITHYQRLLDYIKPDFVHVMMEGRIVRTGGAELALELEEKGYQLC